MQLLFSRSKSSFFSLKVTVELCLRRSLEAFIKLVFHKHISLIITGYIYTYLKKFCSTEYTVYTYCTLNANIILLSRSSASIIILTHFEGQKIWLTIESGSFTDAQYR